MGREVTGARLADGGPGGHRWGPDLWEMKWRAGDGAAAAPGGALVQPECGTWRSRLSGEVLGWGAHQPGLRVACVSRSRFQGSGEAVAAPPVGEGKIGCVGGGRSDADAKVAASGHHFCAPTQNPGVKAAAALLTRYLEFRGLWTPPAPTPGVYP